MKYNLLIFVTLIASAPAFAKLVEGTTQQAANQPIGPNDVVAYSDFVVRCFSESMIDGKGSGIHHIVNGNAIPGGPGGMLARCRSLRRSEIRLTPSQYSAIRKHLIKSFNGSKDQTEREKIQNALFQLNELEHKTPRTADVNGGSALTTN